MMVIPHACTGAALGRFLGMRPVSALVLGMGSHALLDMLPHKDISAHKAEGAATGVALALVGTSCGFRSPAFWCAVGGVLPDLEQVLPWTDPKRGRRRWFPTHNPLLHSVKLPSAPQWRISLLTQVAISTLALVAATTRCAR